MRIACTNYVVSYSHQGEVSTFPDKTGKYVKSKRTTTNKKVNLIESTRINSDTSITVHT